MRITFPIGFMSRSYGRNSWRTISGRERRDTVDEEYDAQSCCCDTGADGEIRKESALVNRLNPVMP